MRITVGIFPHDNYNALRFIVFVEPRKLPLAASFLEGPLTMNKAELRARVEEIGLIPVIRTSSAEDARFAVEEVSHGGIPLVEVTMTVPGAIEVIRDVVKHVPGVILGAGTVLDVDTARRCIDAGAQFIGCPALDLPTVEFVAKNPNVIMMAGAMTPTEVLLGWKAGSDFMKLFPCSLIGADSYVRALRRPFPDIPLVAGGGITQQNAAHYLLAGAAALSIGKELIPRESMLLHKPDRIRELTRRFASIVRTSRARLAEAQSQAVPSVM